MQSIFTTTVSHTTPSREHFTEEIFDTEVKVEFCNGCFMGGIKITAFDGEVEIHIHFNSGHYLHWAVVISRCDSALEVLKCNEYDKETKIGGAIVAITEHFGGQDGHWWTNFAPEFNKILDTET